MNLEEVKRTRPSFPADIQFGFEAYYASKFHSPYYPMIGIFNS